MGGGFELRSDLLEMIVDIGILLHMHVALLFFV